MTTLWEGACEKTAGAVASQNIKDTMIFLDVFMMMDFCWCSKRELPGGPASHACLIHDAFAMLSLKPGGYGVHLIQGHTTIRPWKSAPASHEYPYRYATAAGKYRTDDGEMSSATTTATAVTEMTVHDSVFLQDPVLWKWNELGSHPFYVYISK